MQEDPLQEEVIPEGLPLVEPLHGNMLYEDPRQENPLRSEHSNSRLVTKQPSKKAYLRPRKPKTFKTSRHGIPYPGVPLGITKSLALTFARAFGERKPRLNKDTLTAIVKAGDQFLEQLCGDLVMYAKHAGRKKIDENDIITAMRR